MKFSAKHLQWMVVALLMTAVLAPAAFADTIRVPGDATTLRQALQQARPGDTIEVTRDIREAWHADLAASNHIRLTAPDGDVTEYFVAGNDLKVERPNGDTGVVYEDLSSITFDTTTVTRNREGTPASADALWYSKPAPGTSPVAFDVPQGGQLSLAFVAPALDSDIPGGGSGDEQVLSAQPGVLTLPLAWITGTNPESLDVALHQSWGPGSAEPNGTALGSVAIADSSLPIAVWNDSDPADPFWEVPSSTVALSLSGLGVTLTPGAGYTLVLSATGDARMLMAAHPELPSPSNDDTAMASGGSYVVQPVTVPFSMTGPYSLTTTAATNEIIRVSIEIVPNGRPGLTRSAALLSQALSEDPWYGVVSGEAAPTTVGVVSP